MKKILFQRFITLLCFVILTTLNYAYDFAANGIYYNINEDGNSVSVTYKTTDYKSYSGHIEIPSKVTSSGSTYNVTSIGDYAFYLCKSLTSITIPNSVNTIGNYAFYGCGLTSVTIPESVSSIGGYAFNVCNSLTKAEFASIDRLCNIDFVGAASNPLRYANHLYINGQEIKDLIIPYGVTSIGDNAFGGCKYLTSVTIPKSVKVIGANAFDSCDALTKAAFASIESLYEMTFVNAFSNPLRYARHLYINGQEVTNMDLVIPEGVTSIGDYAFIGCYAFTSVTIPNSVTYIGTLAFNGCKYLNSVTIPNSVATIGYSAFLSTAWYNNQPNGMVYAGKVAYAYKGSMPEGTHIELEEGTLGIAGHAFYQCSGLTSITLPETLTNIGERSFFECTGLTSINIPNSVTSIGNYAFQKCTGLTSIPVPNSVTSIGYNAFTQTAWYDSQPDGMVYAGKIAYKYKGTMPEGTHIELEEGTLGIAGSAFQEYSGLTSITIPNSVITIGCQAFDGCYGLSSINIPNSVTNIGNYAFTNCSCLLSVTCQAQNVPTTGYECFKYVPQSSATLYVPESAIDDYKAATPWSGFGTIVGIEPEYILGDANGNDEVEIGDVTSVLTLMATPEATGYDTKAADANKNGEIEIGDVTTILTIMAGE